MTLNQVDLASIFGTITQTLAENQQELNRADGFNQDHGNNMVQTFGTITQALQQKQRSSDSAALKYAAKQLSKKTTSSSGQLYAQHLSQAATQLQSKPVDPRGAVALLQTLIGGQTEPSAAQAGGGDAEGAILGSLSGSGNTPSQLPSQSGGDLMSSLLGGLTGSGSSSPAGQSGFGMDDIMNAGMAFVQAKQQGGSNTNAVVQAFMAGSGMGNASHREQSTQLVVSSFLQGLGSLMGNNKTG